MNHDARSRSLNGHGCVAIVARMAATIRENEPVLSALDAATGDGDHGTNLAGGLAAAAAAVAALDEPQPEPVFTLTGRTLLAKMGGASGALFGSFFRAGARAIKACDVLQVADVAAFWQAGLETVMRRGKAQPGDKTMVDALAPAAAALSQAAAADAPLAMALRQAAEAAEQGAATTREMTAAFGRAKFLGDRSIGHQDAGATSMALLAAAWADVIQDLDREAQTTGADDA